MVHDHQVGYLDIVGHRDSRTATQNLERVLDLLEPFEQQLNELAGYSILASEPNAIHGENSPLPDDIAPQRAAPSKRGQSVASLRLKP
jgi:hypothetical protein